MNQTPVFRNINIFFSYSNVWFLHLHSTKNYTQTCRPAVHNCYDWGRPVVAGGDAGAGKGWIARNSFSFFSFSLFLSWGSGYTHILREVEGLYIVLDTAHSTPPPIHGPSFSHSVAFSLDHHHAHAHMINYTLFTFSLSFSSTHILPRLFPRLRVICSDIFFLSSFSPF